MKKTKIIIASLIVAAMSLTSSSALALSGANADNAKIKIYTKQGGDWFRALYIKTNSDGVLEVKNALPGKYKIEVKSSDIEDGQIIAGKFRMLDEDGKRLREKTDVDVYMYISDVKTLIATIESDKEGWINLASVTPNAIYEFDVRGTADLSSKDEKYRIKVSTKIDDSEWYRSRYERTDTDKTLVTRDVIPGKYKFRYKRGDAPANVPFSLQLKMLNDDKERIDEETTVNLYAYIGGQKALVGTLQTDDDGWIVVPGVLTEMKYKISVK